MLTKEMTQKLNDQLNLEFYSSNLYLQMSAWCDDKNFSNFARFLRDHAKEEMQHMHRLFDYVQDCGSLAIIGKIDAPETEYQSLADVFQKAYAHELVISQAINQLVDHALTKKIMLLFNFYNGTLPSSTKKKKLFKTIVDKLELVGDKKRDLFFMDKDFDQVLAESGLLNSNNA